MRFARSNNAAKRQPERATPWHRMLKDTKDDDDEDSNEAAASSTPSDLAPKRKSVEPDEEEVKAAAANAKVSKVEGATDVTTKAANAKKDVEDVSDDDGEDEVSEDGEDDEAEGAEDDDEVEGADGSEDDDDEEEEEDDEDEKPAAKKTSPKAAKGNSKVTEKPIATGTVCFKCRQAGHLMRDCPNTKPGEDANICYKCGSTEHFAYKCKIKSKESMPYAKCFICTKMGHIARNCPQNKNGVYPNGGKCDLCDSNKHFKSECPTITRNRNQQQKVMVSKRGAAHVSADVDDCVEFYNSSQQRDSISSKKTKKTVKF